MGDCPDALAGKNIVFLGRLAALRRRQAEHALALRGGLVRRGLTRRSHLLVVGRAAYDLLEHGRLEHKLAQAERFGVSCISESEFLRLAGLAAPAAPEARPVSVAELQRQSGLDAQTLRLLALFDVIAPQQEACRFRDLVAAREVARLLREGVTLAEVLQGAAVLTQRRGGDLAASRLVRLRPDSLGLRLGDALAELDGQMLLPLDEEAAACEQPFEEAEQAEAEGDLARAERLYGRCAQADPADPTVRFNLANVLRQQGRERDAELHYRMAVELDPGFAEAWYNLAYLVGERERPDLAEAYLERALAAAPDFADAIYNMAHLRYERGDFAGAIDAWERYLRYDRDSEWARKARAGLALCRQGLRAGRA
jgi:tetratricopeptide (TPR) repeat protein